MKRLIALLCLCCAVLTVEAAADFTGDISAESAILYCAGTGDVLYEKNADERHLIASITKMMTAIVVIENCDLDQSITPKPEWCAVEGSSMYLDYTKSYTLREILTGMLLVSGNDAATALACHMCGDERSFSAKMNEKAKELGMTNSSFRNPHGLDDEEHYSTARDMAILAEYCMENDEFRSIVSRYSATVDVNTYYNHNKLLINYDGCIGVKTGYTVAAGRTLVSCAERNGLRLICVTLNAPDDWNDHRKLLDHGFQNYSVTSFGTDNVSIVLPVISGCRGSYSAVPTKDIRLVTENNDAVDIRLSLPKILFAGGIKGEKVGSISVFVNGALAAEEDLVYTENVPVSAAERLTVTERFARALSFGLRPLYPEQESYEGKNTESNRFIGPMLTQSG